MTLVTRQSMTDDGGDFISGTEVDKAFVDQVYDQIDDQAHSTTNPTIKPKAITDEVVAARGSKASLDARLDVVLEEDGTLKSQASLVTGTQLSAAISRNYWPDSLFALWPNGDASAPYGWVLSGTGAAVARCGAGGASYEASAPADTTKMQWGRFCARLTYGSDAAKLTRTLIAAADFPTGLRGKTISVAMRCKSSVASAASFVVDDGVTTTRGGATGNGTYHTGSGSEELIYCTHTFSNSATKLDIYAEVGLAGLAYFGCGVLVNGSFVPTDWIPERWGYVTLGFQVRGTLATGTIINEWRQPIPLACLLELVSLRVKTAPLTTAIIIDLNKNGANSAYDSGAGRPQIAASATSGTDARPDGTYAYRCFAPNDYLTLDIDQIGTGTVGEEMSGFIRLYAPMTDFDMLGI